MITLNDIFSTYSYKVHFLSLPLTLIKEPLPWVALGICIGRNINKDRIFMVRENADIKLTLHFDC